MCRERGPELRGKSWEKETDTLPVSNQRSCGAEFKAGMGQTSKLLELCHFHLPPPTFSEERGKKKKRREEGRWKEANENQTHSPVWSGCEQWGRWCHKSGVGFSSYLFLHFDISPSTSVWPFFKPTVPYFLIFFLVFVPLCCQKYITATTSTGKEI